MPEIVSLSKSKLQVIETDSAEAVLNQDVAQGPIIMGASHEKILVHRKAIMAVIAEARLLRERNKALQAGIDEAGKENEQLANICQMSLKRIAELEGVPYPETPKPE